MLQHTLDILRNGYSYDALLDDGNTKTVYVAPNKYMIFAATEISKLVDHVNILSFALETERARVIELEAHCAKYRESIKELSK